MTDVLLTFYCAVADGAAIADALRNATGRPVHLRDEMVFGLDFSDASTAERVTGQLDRAAIDLIVGADTVETLVAEISGLKRAASVRWHAMAVLSEGRLS